MLAKRGVTFGLAILRCGFSARARISCICGVRVKLNSTGETETSK